MFISLRKLCILREKYWAVSFSYCLLCKKLDCRIRLPLLSSKLSLTFIRSVITSTKATDLIPLSSYPIQLSLSRFHTILLQFCFIFDVTSLLTFTVFRTVFCEPGVNSFQFIWYFSATCLECLNCIRGIFSKYTQ